MHIVLYGHNITELYGLSPAVSIILLFGAGYGFLRFLGDLLHLALGGELYPRRHREREE